ncbi:T9SS type A sorting domain-containing protein [Dyadobacter tibetensis]|uniref:T9SS type A sorting domain-containing protein n=1 Tax=Dyadobacter tibetensis TaxID=1211851 RepID=UPI00046F5622|nr:T9SS type A sorting domain-containing protein [Dyadobacter tibetensis]
MKKHKLTIYPGGGKLLGWVQKLSLGLLLGLMSFQTALATNETFPAGAFIVNMGVMPQTTGNGLKPYGMVYDLLKNYNVNVRWVLDEGKAKDGIDFTHNGVSYKGSAFIIPANMRTPAVNAAISSWQSKGVVGVTTTSSLTVDVDYVLRVAPRWVLDQKNGKIAAGFFEEAGIPATAHGGSSDKYWKEPSALNSCDDIFVMPHADPTWETHSNLYYWNKDYKGAIWAGCHAVSVLENVKNPGNTIQLNFLTSGVPNGASTGLIDFGDHDDPETPYTHQLPGNPVAQYLGITDEAQTNGSEQVYLPKAGGGWLPSTNMITYATIIKKTTVPPGTAAINIYGRAFGDNTRGQVMYQAGHDIGGDKPENIAAQRIFFNWSFLAIIDKAPNLSLTLPPGSSEFVGAGSAIQLGAVSTTPGITYKWTSSCGGTFNNSTIANPIYTAPSTTSNTPCLISVTVTDACGRETVETKSITVVSPITFTGSVFNDLNGLTDNNVNGTKIGNLASAPSNIPLYVNISNASGIVVGSVAVDASTGNYAWTTSSYNNEAYTFSLSTAQAPLNQPRPANPTQLIGQTGDTWANTGENIGTGAGSDATPNGEVVAVIAGAGISNINFGIVLAPKAGQGANTTVNKPGTQFVDVPLNTFVNTTPSSGAVSKIRITAIPSTATALKINGVTYDSSNPIPAAGIVITTDATGLPVSGTTISIDPIAEGATSVTIPFKAINTAGIDSPNTGQAVMTLTAPSIIISGSVFNDANGLNDQKVNGLPIGNLGTSGEPIPLYVNVSNASGTILASLPVDPVQGQYAWTNAPDEAATYTLALSMVPATVGQPRPANPTLLVGKLGDKWVNTGENIGTGNGNDGNPNGELSVTTSGAGGISDANFGIELAPIAGHGTATANNAPGDGLVEVPMTAFTSVKNSTDAAPGNVAKIVITSMPTNATAIKINGVTYDSVNPFPLSGVELATDNNGLPIAGISISVDPTVSGPTTVTIPFKAIDNANIPSDNKGSEGTAVLTLLATPVTITGLVWNDENSNGLRDGGESGSNAGGLFVNLVDNTNHIIGSASVASNGTYLLADVPSNKQGYKLVLAATNNSTSPSLPTKDWMNTAKQAGSGNGATQSPNLGSIDLITQYDNIANQNFGIHYSTPLPVKLISFTAKGNEGAVNLSWETAEEENFSHFEIERSADGKQFETMKEVRFHGEHLYSIMDGNPLTGNNYYRLKMVDLDGSFAYSRTQVIKVNGNISLKIFPNPVADRLSVQATDSIIVKLIVLDKSGKVVAASNESAGINVSQLPSGMYILQATMDNNSVQHKKFIVNR